MGTFRSETPSIRKVTLQEHLTMLAMYEAGYMLKDIAAYTGKSISTVKRHVYS